MQFDCKIHVLTIVSVFNRVNETVYIAYFASTMHNNFTMFDLDDIDLRLLDLLQGDAGLTNQDLAAAAHVSPATACAACGG